MTLNEKLCTISHEIGAIPKTKKHDSGVNYAFRGIDDVMNALNPLLAKHGVTMNVRVNNFSMEARTIDKKTYTQFARTAVVDIALIFSDGEKEEVTQEVACSEDFSDKAYTQAMSMAFKYAILRKFCIPTTDLEDPDAKPLPPPKGETKGEAKENARPPVPKKKLPIKEMDGNSMTKAWANLMGKLSSGVATIEMAEGAYELTPEQREKLLTYVKQNSK